MSHSRTIRRLPFVGRRAINARTKTFVSRTTRVRFLRGATGGAPRCSLALRSLALPVALDDRFGFRGREGRLASKGGRMGDQLLIAPALQILSQDLLGQGFRALPLALRDEPKVIPKLLLNRKIRHVQVPRRSTQSIGAPASTGYRARHERDTPHYVGWAISSPASRWAQAAGHSAFLVAASRAGPPVRNRRGEVALWQRRS